MLFLLPVTSLFVLENIALTNTASLNDLLHGKPLTAEDAFAFDARCNTV